MDIIYASTLKKTKQKLSVFKFIFLFHSRRFCLNKSRLHYNKGSLYISNFFHVTSNISVNLSINTILYILVKINKTFLSILAQKGIDKHSKKQNKYIIYIKITIICQEYTCISLGFCVLIRKNVRWNNTNNIQSN